MNAASHARSSARVVEIRHRASVSDEVCQRVEMDSAVGRRVAGQGVEHARGRGDQLRSPTCEIGHDLRALAGRPASETSFVAQILGESLGARRPLSNPGTLTCRKSARIA